MFVYVRVCVRVCECVCVCVCARVCQCVCVTSKHMHSHNNFQEVLNIHWECLLDSWVEPERSREMWDMESLNAAVW